jgi:hypothetical protein
MMEEDYGRPGVAGTSVMRLKKGSAEVEKCALLGTAAEKRFFAWHS